MRFVSFKKCPLCSSKNYKKKYFCYPNRYSEEIASYLKVSEGYILKKIYNVECANCGLIYKRYWFSDKNLYDLFNKIIPIHPKCSDRFSNKFSKKYFSKIFSLYLKEPINGKKFNMYKRTIFSIVDSIKKNKLLKKRFISYLEKNNKSKLIKLNKQIIQFITVPESFKRFSGYDTENFFNFINVKNKLYNYGELGCPNWGMLNKAKKKGLKTYFVYGDKTHFWTCKQKIYTKKISFKNLNKLKDKLDFLGVFFYLDHIKRINFFIKKIFKNTQSIGILLEKINSKKVAIQHFTGWNIKSIKYLSKKYNKNLSYKFKEPSNSDINFFLLN